MKVAARCIALPMLLLLLLSACDAPRLPPAPLAATPVDLLQGLQVPTAFSYQNSAARDPFADKLPQPESTNAPPARRSPDSLRSVQLRQLRWLGSIASGDQRYALLQTPDGAVHRAGLHERIGIVAAEIIAIDAQGLQLRDAHGQRSLLQPSEQDGVQR